MSASAPPTAAGERWYERDAFFGLFLFVVALAPRLWVALAWAGEPVWDGHYYDFGAHRIAEGHGYSDDLTGPNGALVWHPWCHYPVGYSAVLGLFYRIFGPSLHVAGALDAVIGALLAVVTWLLASHAMPRLRARVAGALMAVHPGMILYAALVMSEPLAALATFVAFWVAARDRSAMRGAACGAILLGLSALVRPQALLCAPFLGFAAMRDAAATHRRWNAPRAIAAAVVMTLLTLAPIAPWTARNCRVMDGCALVSTNGGWNLAIGAFPRATGRFETLHASDGCRDVTGQVQQDRCWFAYGLHEIVRHPVHWLKLVPAKLGYTFDHESFAVEYLREARPADWPEERRVRARDATTLMHRLLLCVAALGCVGVSFRGMSAVVQAALLMLVASLIYAGFALPTPIFWPLAVVAAVVPWLPLPGAPPWPWALRLPVALLGTTLLTHAIFFGEDRYHVVVTPVLCMLAAGALRRSTPPAATWLE